MLTVYKHLQKAVTLMVILLLSQTITQAQTTPPTWWFGVSGAANYNFYDGTTQRLNNGLIVPAAFHKGKAFRPYGSILMEYRPGKVWGAMLNLAYDGRGAKFDDVIAPCNCPATLKTNMSYFAIEPSLRVAPFSGNFYLFAGPRIAINAQKDFDYTQLRQTDKSGEISEMRKTLLSGQVGLGYDIPVTAAGSKTQFVISPFASYHPYFGQDPRNIESWSVQTIRAGVALKFGKSKQVKVAEVPVLPARDVIFSIRAPKEIIFNRPVSETLPLLNYIFFDEGSSAIPSRYVLLDHAQAAAFRETQLQDAQGTGTAARSDRQLNVYHNVLNILGDRLRMNKQATITLSGAGADGPKEGEAFAVSVKEYLVNAFDISSSRIATNGRNKPVHPSEQPGATRELELLRAGDRRVDIISAAPELLMEVGGSLMKPVQINATQAGSLDNQVAFTVDGASELLKSWTLDVVDEKGTSRLFGPFTKDLANVSGKEILQDQTSGNYKVFMQGIATNGTYIKKESTLQLVSQTTNGEKGIRYSILFDFDESKTKASYENFLSTVVAPLIADGSKVTIHGHTDVIGVDTYNMALSQRRATEAQDILKRALSESDKKGVTFETSGFGENVAQAPFENGLPEERFYNRTVIIDIIISKM